MKRILDEFTDLNVSRQRKWQLRHPEADNVIRKRFKVSIKGLVYNREWMRKYIRAGRRSLNSKSYQMEKENNEK